MGSRYVSRVISVFSSSADECGAYSPPAHICPTAEVSLFEEATEALRVRLSAEWLRVWKVRKKRQHTLLPEPWLHRRPDHRSPLQSGNSDPERPTSSESAMQEQATRPRNRILNQQCIVQRTLAERSDLRKSGTEERRPSATALQGSVRLP